MDERIIKEDKKRCQSFNVQFAVKFKIVLRYTFASIQLLRMFINY